MNKKTTTDLDKRIWKLVDAGVLTLKFVPLRGESKWLKAK